jgi:hypothetical protein
MTNSYVSYYFHENWGRFSSWVLLQEAPRHESPQVSSVSGIHILPIAFSLITFFIHMH